jgi:tetratricopeptide (TPR) repeat protein
VSDQRATLERFIWAALPALVALALYAPTLTHGYFSDDHTLIVDNPYLKRWDGVVDLVSRDLWDASGLAKSTQYYRPLPMLSFWLQTLTLGFSAAWLRLGNVMLLAAGGLMLAALLRRQWPSLPQPAVALIACAWVAHPLNSEATIWLSGRFDLFLMLGVIAALTLNLGESRRWSVPLVFAASVLCKEPAVILLPVLVVQDYFARRPLRGELGKALGLIAVAMAYLGLRQLIGVAGASAVQSSAPLVLLQSYATLLAVFGRLLLLPVGLDARHWYTPVAWPLAIALLALGSLGVALAVKRAVRQPGCSGLVVGVTLSALSLAPVSLVGPNQQIYGDRFAGLFVLGLALASGALQPLVALFRVHLRWLSAMALLGCWSLLTVLRGAEWSSEERLIDSALSEHPEHPDWRVLQSHRFLTQGNPQAAIESLSQVTQANPSYAKAWNALCVAYLRTEQTQHAHAACHNALQLDDASPSVWVNWATVQVAQRNWQEAIQAAERALQIRRTYPEAQYLVAVSLAQLGRLAEAEQHVVSGLADEPTHAALNDLKRQLDRRRAH